MAIDMKTSEKAKLRIKIYLTVIALLLGFFGYKMYYYWPKIYSNYHEKQVLEAKYNDLLAEEDTLSDDIVKLQDPDYIARYAREKYLYSKNGEIIIRILE